MGTCDEHTGVCDYPVRFGGFALQLPLDALLVR